MPSAQPATMSAASARSARSGACPPRSINPPPVSSMSSSMVASAGCRSSSGPTTSLPCCRRSSPSSPRRMSAYRFRPFTRADLPMAARWLRTPEVVRWWGDPATELTLLAQDLDEPAMRQWIVEHRDRPLAYVQVYSAGAWPQAHRSEEHTSELQSHVNLVCRLL